MNKFVCVMLVAAALLSASPAWSAHGDAKPDKVGILVSSFGTSMPEARPAIDNLVEAAKKAFPDAEVRLAFTSNIIPARSPASATRSCRRRCRRLPR